jgi:hypothetical protein
MEQFKAMLAARKQEIQARDDVRRLRLELEDNIEQQRHHAAMARHYRSMMRHHEQMERSCEDETERCRAELVDLEISMRASTSAKGAPEQSKT